MSPRHAGRHRSSAPSRGRHRSTPTRNVRGVVRPLSLSVVSCGAVLALLHTMSGPSWGEANEAAALPRTAAMALSASPPATGGPTSPAASPSTTPVAPASASGVATARPAPKKPKAAPPKKDLGKTWTMPVSGASFTSNYGMRWGTMHRGIDLAAPIGTPLRSMSSGIVVFAGQQSGYGNLVQIRYWDGTLTYYGHMNAIAVTVGQPLLPGQVVGEVGNTGQSTGPHLHLEIHPGGTADIDPEPWLRSHGLKAR